MVLSLATIRSRINQDKDEVACLIEIQLFKRATPLKPNSVLQPGE